MPLAPKHPWFNTSTDRMVVLRFPAVPTNDEVRSATVAMVDFYEQKRTARPWIIELSDLEEITASQRRMLADYEHRVIPLSTLYVKRLAYVVTKPLIRAALTAYFWILRPPPYPYRVFSDRALAEAWVLGTGPDDVDARSS